MGREETQILEGHRDFRLRLAARRGRLRQGALEPSPASTAPEQEGRGAWRTLGRAWKVASLVGLVGFVLTVGRMIYQMYGDAAALGWP